MAAIKNGVKFFCNNLFLNLLISILLTIGSVLIVLVSMFSTHTKAYLIVAKPLLDKGLVYVNTTNDKPSAKYDKTDFEGCEDVYKIYNNNMVVSGGIAELRAYNLDLLKLMDLELVEGRFPQTGNTFEVLAEGEQYNVGDVIPVVLEKKNYELKVVGKLQSNSLYLQANGSGDGMGLKNAFSRGIDSQQLPTKTCGTLTGLVENFKDDLTFYQWNIFVKYDNAYLTANENDIIKDAQTKGNAYTFDDMYNVTKQALRQSIAVLTTILVLAIGIAASMLITNLIMLFNKKIKYLAVLYVGGFSLKNIRAMLMVYSAISVSISYLLAISFIGVFAPIMFPLDASFVVNAWSYIIPLLCGCAFFCIALIVSSVELAKNNLVEKISGEME